jgi:hypothetical protein
MSLVSQISSLATRIATEVKAVRSELASGLAGKASTSHTHAISDVTNLQTTLDGKASTSHTHNASAVTVTVSDKSANYTIVAGDKNTIIRSTNSAITITLANVLAVGERIDFIQDGAGQITFVASGVTLQSADAKTKTAKQYAAASVVCVASGQYRLIGNLG